MKKLRRASPTAGTGPLSAADVDEEDPHRPDVSQELPPEDEGDSTDAGTLTRRRPTTGFLNRNR